MTTDDKPSGGDLTLSILSVLLLAYLGASVARVWQVGGVDAAFWVATIAACGYRIGSWRAFSRDSKRLHEAARKLEDRAAAADQEEK